MKEFETIFSVFSEATKETFRIQCDLGIDAIKYDQKYNSQVTSILGFNSSKFQGIFSLSFPQKTMTKVLMGLLGEEVPTNSPDFADAVSELTNIIFGVAKKNLNSNGHDFQMAIPKLFVGDNIYLPKSAGTEEFLQYFSVTGDEFQIKIAIKSIA